MQNDQIRFTFFSYLALAWILVAYLVRGYSFYLMIGNPSQQYVLESLQCCINIIFPFVLSIPIAISIGRFTAFLEVTPGITQVYHLRVPTRSPNLPPILQLCSLKPTCDHLDDSVSAYIMLARIFGVQFRTATQASQDN